MTPSTLVALARQTKPTLSTLADGVYFGLDAEIYRADPALGSSDMKLLAYSPADYWWGSVLNPDREPEESTPAKVFGSAVHKIILEGRQAFEGSYGPTDHSGATKAGKDERATLADSGRIPLKREDWLRCLAASAAVAGNTHLSEAFSGGMTEVSIIWTRDGVRRKARLDCLKVRATTDLKTIRPQRPTTFRENCIRAFSDLRYDVQWAHYHEARVELARFAAEGAVQGDHDPVWLARVLPEGAFVFVFLRAEGPPLTFGWVLSPENPILIRARETLDFAAENYRAALDEFGPDRPWIGTDPLEELEIDSLPLWHGRNTGMPS